MIRPSRRPVLDAIVSIGILAGSAAAQGIPASTEVIPAHPLDITVWRAQLAGHVRRALRP